MGERAEEVVVEADPGRDRGVARAVDAERDRDVGLARAAGDRDAAAFAGTDLDVTERVVIGKPVVSALAAPVPSARRRCGFVAASAAAISRSFSSALRTVRRRWSASGWPSSERPRHEAARHQPFGDRPRALWANRNRRG